MPRAPTGIPAHTVDEAVAAAATIGDDEVVIKSQILAGGRGLGTFTNGLQGGVHIIKTSEVKDYAEKMLGGTLVTKQSGPAGKPVNTLLLAKKMSLAKEFYFAIFSEFFFFSEPRALRAPVMMVSDSGSSHEILKRSGPLVRRTAHHCVQRGRHVHRGPGRV